MTRSNRFLGLAAVAVSGALLGSLSGYAQDRQDYPKQDRDRIAQQDRAHMPQGIKWSDEAADLGDVRGVLDDIAGAAVIENGFNDVVERFVDQDRNRFGEWMDQGENREFTEFNAAAKRFQEAYKTKFNKDFDFDAEKALASITAVQGEVEDPTLVAANWPVPAMAGMEMPGEPRVAGERAPTDEQGNIQKGRQVAIVTIPAPHKATGMGGERPGDRLTGDRPGERQPGDRPDAGAERRPAQGAEAGVAQAMRSLGGELHVSLVNEFPGAWKVDVPNSRLPQQVYSDLAQRVGKLADSTAQWPSEESQVQHVIAYEVLCAIYGADSSQAGQMRDRMDGADKPADRPGSDDGMGGGQ